MTKPQCDSCKFWEYTYKRIFKDIDREDETIGECCIRSTINDQFPERFENEWCGEYQRKEPEC